MYIWIYYENGWWCWCWCDAGKGWRRESHFQGTIVTSMYMGLALNGTYPVIEKFHTGAWLLTSKIVKDSRNLVIVFKSMTGKQEDPCLHNDWVSVVSGSNPGFILTGCYDGFGRVWKGGSRTHILEGHGDAITSVSIINQKGAKSSLTTDVATASKERTVRLWMLDAEETTNNVRAFKILRGHSSSVQSVAPQPSREMDLLFHEYNLWRTNESDSDGDLVSVKKRKVNSKVEESHLEFCGKVLNDLDVGGDNSALIAAGGSDLVLRIWDPRKSGDLNKAKHKRLSCSFASHSSWITAWKWHDSSRQHILSSTLFCMWCPDEDVENIKEATMQDMKSIMRRIEKSGTCVCVQASIPLSVV
ncbi:hypothetical protein MKW92_036244 [Papaver armeniacum]|nr:hypothetical protein MKW92_036244 [Papaver armeniacum]